MSAGPTATVWQGGGSVPGLAVNVAKACPSGEDAAACPVPLCAPPPSRGHRAGNTWSGADAQGAWFRSGFRHYGPAGSWARETRQPGLAARGHVGARWHQLACTRLCSGARQWRGVWEKARRYERTAATPWSLGKPQAPATGCLSASYCRGTDRSPHRQKASDRNIDNTSLSQAGTHQPLDAELPQGVNSHGQRNRPQTC